MSWEPAATTVEIMPAPDPERFEWVSRVSGCWAAIALSFGIVVLAIVGSFIVFGGALKHLEVSGALVLLFLTAFGIFLVLGGIRTMRQRGTVVYVLRGDSEGFQWGKTGAEFSVRFADIAEIEYDDTLGDSSQTTIRMKDGTSLNISRYFDNHSGAFRYMRRHFGGPMIWRAKKIKSPDEWLY